MKHQIVRCLALLRALVILTLVLACTIPTRAAVAEIEHVTGNYPNTASGTIQLPNFGTATVAGETIVAALCVQNGVGATPVTDSAGGTYTQVLLTDNIGASGENITCAIYYRQNVGAGVTWVSCQESAGSGHGTCWASHATGMATVGVLETSATFPGTAGHSPWSSTGINTTNANDWLVGISLGVRQTANSSMTLTGSWSTWTQSTGANFDGNNGNAGIPGSQIVTVAQTGVQFTGTDTGGANVDNYAAIAAFKGAVATPCYKSLMGAGIC